MYGYIEAPRAFWHAHGMARSCGVRLAGAVVDGVINRNELAQLVDRCQQCSHLADCEQWLSNLHEGQTAPEFCALREPLQQLSPLK